MNIAEIKQRMLVEKIKLASEYLSQHQQFISADWLMTNIIGHDRISIRKHKINKILNDKAGEI